MDFFGINLLKENNLVKVISKITVGEAGKKKAESVDEECVEYVYSSAGLYPLPLARNSKSSHKNKIKSKFVFLGKFIAKAVLDNRMIDLPFSAPFYTWLLHGEQSLSSTRGDLHHIDPTIASTISQLEVVRRQTPTFRAAKIALMFGHMFVLQLRSVICVNGPSFTVLISHFTSPKIRVRLWVKTC